LGFQPGCRAAGSTFAERLLSTKRWLTTIPQSVSNNDIVALSLMGITAHLDCCGKLLKGSETLFVNGGTRVSSASSRCRVQVQVVTTAGGDRCVIAVSLARTWRSVQTQDVDAALRSLHPGINVWWKHCASELRARHPAAGSARPNDRHGRSRCPAAFRRPLLRQDCSLHGFAVQCDSSEQRAAAEDINQWLVEGTLKPRIDRVLPLSHTAEAHRLQEDSTVKSGILSGKIILNPDALNQFQIKSQI
jgi:NADPH:quinone reductase-like Zn-dependent oxidoreductase